jgi:hypothetical protein
VHFVAISDDGQTAATAGDDGEAKLRNAHTGASIGQQRHHQDWILALAFQPGRKLVATGSQDGTVRVWDVATGQPIGPVLRPPGAIANVAFLFGGKNILTQSDAPRQCCVLQSLPDNPERESTWVEVVTGLTFDRQQGLFQVLDNQTWLVRRERLEELGGAANLGRP